MNASVFAPCLDPFQPPQCMWFGWCLQSVNSSGGVGFSCLCHPGTAGPDCSTRLLLDAGVPAYLSLQYLWAALALACGLLALLVFVEGLWRWDAKKAYALRLRLIGIGTSMMSCWWMAAWWLMGPDQLALESFSRLVALAVTLNMMIVSLLGSAAVLTLVWIEVATLTASGNSAATTGRRLMALALNVCFVCAAVGFGIASAYVPWASPVFLVSTGVCLVAMLVIVAVSAIIVLRKLRTGRQLKTSSDGGQKDARARSVAIRAILVAAAGLSAMFFLAFIAVINAFTSPSAVALFALQALFGVAYVPFLCLFLWFFRTSENGATSTSSKSSTGGQHQKSEGARDNRSSSQSTDAGVLEL